VLLSVELVFLEGAYRVIGQVIFFAVYTLELVRAGFTFFVSNLEGFILLLPL